MHAALIGPTAAERPRHPGAVGTVFAAAFAIEIRAATACQCPPRNAGAKKIKQLTTRESA